MILLEIFIICLAVTAIIRQIGMSVIAAKEAKYEYLADLPENNCERHVWEELQPVMMLGLTQRLHVYSCKNCGKIEKIKS